MDNETLSTTVETTDNSSSTDNDQALIDEILNEPEETTEQPTDNQQDDVQEETKDNTVKYPEKFLKDGQLDVDKLLESYTNLEKHSSQQAEERKQEQAELKRFREEAEAQQKQAEEQARKAGYDNQYDMQNAYEVANFEANEYSRYLQYVDPETRDDVYNLLVQYANNPSKELMSQIEMEFAPEINKEIAVKADRIKQQYESQKRTQAETQKMSNIESVISKSVDANKELFDNDSFKDLFINTLYKYGDNFTFEDAQMLMETAKQLQVSAVEAFKKANSIKTDNNNATDKLASLTGTSSAQKQQKSLIAMSDKELDNWLDTII